MDNGPWTIWVRPPSQGHGVLPVDGGNAAAGLLWSAVVLQQAMWFAQNDSLAKRLGDLRLSHGPHGA
jgi:hypothetical protein